jgi:multisubunit Na+/H+ antiporter MnhG subunit
MTLRTIFEAAALAVMLLGALLSLMGLLRSRDAMAAIHCASFACITVPVPFAIAVAIGKLGSEATVKAVVLLAIVLASGPIASHALARSVWVRSRK